MYDHSNKRLLCTIYGDKNVYELSKLCARSWLAQEKKTLFKYFNSTAEDTKL